MELVSRMPHRWPLSFQALISRYQFPSFCCGPLEFYSVGLDNSPDDYDELRTAVLRDPAMLSVLWGMDTCHLHAQRTQATIRCAFTAST